MNVHCQVSAPPGFYSAGPVFQREVMTSSGSYGKTRGPAGISTVQGFLCMVFLACSMLFLAGGCGGAGGDTGGSPPVDTGEGPPVDSPDDRFSCPPDQYAPLILILDPQEEGPEVVLSVTAILDSPAPSGGTRVTIVIELKNDKGDRIADPGTGIITIAEGETAAAGDITVATQTVFETARYVVFSAESDNPVLRAGCTLNPLDETSSTPSPSRPAPPTRPNPVQLEFRPRDLETPQEPDGQNYRTAEFMGHWGLGEISADEAYKRGYFGQGVTIAVAESGVDVTHPDLAGKIRDPWHLLNGNSVVRESCRGGGHGTYVSLIAAASMDNPGETFEIDLEGNCRVVTKNAHGVAPQASIMPISMAGGETPVDAVPYAVRNNANVVNFSIGVGEGVFYYGKYAGREGVWLTLPGTLPFFRPLLNLTSLGDRFRRDFADVAEAIENQDIVLVWAAGNQHWNSETRSYVDMCGKNFIDEDGCELGEVRVTTEEFMENFNWINDPYNNPDRTISFKDMWGTGCGEDNCAEYNSPGEWLEAPFFESRLLGKWLAVAASGEDGRIAGFSNGCGAARNWCLVAPGENLTVNVGTHGIDGTSFAAPMVSGALAVLKSRFRDMPMEVIQAILLVSADPVGEREMNPEKPDPVYGWGLLNLGRAIVLQGDVRLPYSVPDMAGAMRGISPGSYRAALVSAFAHAGAGQGGSLYRGQCASPYEIIRRYRSELTASRFWRASG